MGENYRGAMISMGVSEFFSDKKSVRSSQMNLLEVVGERDRLCPKRLKCPPPLQCEAQQEVALGPLGRLGFDL